MDESNKIDRKEAIKRTALLIGGAVFAPNALGVLQGCTAQPGVDWNPVLFTNEQAKMTTALADVIIPADEYPSASEAGVPAFIESMINDVYTDEQQAEFLEGLDAFAEKSRLELDGDFYDSTQEDRYKFTYSENQNSLEIQRDQDVPFFLRFKELTILGYFTSEVGATEVLRYEPVPGMYNGCMPFEEVGRAWAT
ncbi:MAG: gluconate 2-dehydrogenase subunit 3 family protein [Balneolaceae bacterium]|nr:gluconate 2-dehydrogenase subunit 3 family protein [Balneolaceae bacterium]